MFNLKSHPTRFSHLTSDTKESRFCLGQFPRGLEMAFLSSFFDLELLICWQDSIWQTAPLSPIWSFKIVTWASWRWGRGPGLAIILWKRAGETKEMAASWQPHPEMCKWPISGWLREETQTPRTISVWGHHRIISVFQISRSFPDFSSGESEALLAGLPTCSAALRLSLILMIFSLIPRGWQQVCKTAWMNKVTLEI